MTDKAQKIREEVERLKRWNNNVRDSTRHMTLQEEDFNRGKHSSYLEILNFIDSFQKEPVSEDLEKSAIKYAQDKYLPVQTSQAFKAGAKWQEKQDQKTIELAEDHAMLAGMEKMKEEMMAKAINGKENCATPWKDAQGDDLPEIDREVIALLDNGKVVFAHRPPEYWDGKNIVTGKVTRHYPKTYDKGGWNIPNVKWWLDCLLPNMED